MTGEESPKLSPCNTWRHGV